MIELAQSTLPFRLSWEMALHSPREGVHYVFLFNLNASLQVIIFYFILQS